MKWINYYKNNKRLVHVCSFALIFSLGLALILTSHSWNLSSYDAMILAGKYLALLGGAGILLAVFRN